MSWIPLTDERRPETEYVPYHDRHLSKPVLVTVTKSKDSEPVVERAYYAAEDDCFYPECTVCENCGEVEYDYAYMGMTVEAWMPMPKPYKKEVKND